MEQWYKERNKKWKALDRKREKQKDWYKSQKMLGMMLFIDGEELPLKEGDCFRIDPQGDRCLRAADDGAMRFICIQTKAGSLEGFTMSDAVVPESGKKPSWL